MKLAGKVVVVIGACGGLGTALVARLAEEGAEALVLGDIDTSALAALAAAQVDKAVVSQRTDVSDYDSVEALVARAEHDFGRIDVMINNAGVLSRNGRIHNLTVDDWRQAVDVNLIGTFNAIRAGATAMRPRRSGSIINTASVSGVTAWAYTAPYGATKAAVIHLTKIAAAEYAKENIRVNCVCPGTFPTAIHVTLPEGALEAVAGRHPMGLGAPEQIVGAYVYLASDDAAWTTGAALMVDGGYSIV